MSAKVNIGSFMPLHGRFLKRNNENSKWLLVGESLHLRAADLFADTSSAEQVSWHFSNRVKTGRELRLKPKVPGRFKVLAQRGNLKHLIRVIVGIQPRQLIQKQNSIPFFFTLVARSGSKLHFVPLVSTPHKNKNQYKGRVSSEIAKHHPAFRTLARAHNTVYRRRVMSSLYVPTDVVSSGLFAIFPNTAIYLGNTGFINNACNEIAAALESLGKRAIGRAKLLTHITKVVESLDPTSFRYSDQPFFPASSSIKRPSITKFAGSVVGDLTSEVARFARNIGNAMGPGGMTTVFTFNSASATLSTRVFDVRAGLSRQLTSCFDVFITPGRSSTVMPGSGFESLRNNRSELPNLGFSSISTLPTRDSFGRGTSQIAGGLGGLLRSLGVGPLGGSRGQQGMDSDGAAGPPSGSPTRMNQVASGGEEGQGGGYTSGSYWDMNAQVLVIGADSPQDATEKLANGGDLVAGINENNDIVVLITGAEPGQGDSEDRDTNDNDESEGAPDLEDDNSADNDGDDTDPKEDDGDDTGDEDTDDEGDGPSGSGGDAGMTVDDGSSGSSGFTLGTITRGGGYTDHGDNDEEDPGSGPMVRPGGEVIYPAEGDTGGLGFSFWGGYNPPIGGETDPVINPVNDGHVFEGVPKPSVSVMNYAGIRVEQFSGFSGGGYPIDGLVSLGMAEGMNGPSRPPDP